MWLKLREGQVEGSVMSEPGVGTERLPVIWASEMMVGPAERRTAAAERAYLGPVSILVAYLKSEFDE